jgi:hypothetical protein
LVSYHPTQLAGDLTFGHFLDTVLDELLRAVAKRVLLPARAQTAMMLAGVHIKMYIQ